MSVDSASARSAEAAADLALVRAVLRGDESAREQLVERLVNLPALLRAKHRRLGAPLRSEQLEDVTQSVLLALWEKLASFDGRVPLPAWAVGFGAFEILRAIERANRDRKRHTELGDVIDPARAQDIASAERLARMFERLDAVDLAILRHKHIESRTFPEIAALLGWPLATVKTRYYRTLEAIRRRAPGDGNEER
jgi:RNA polymerase sigma-70 factor (ECF subfamily)